MTTADKYDLILNSGYGFEIANVVKRFHGEWDVRIIWRHIQEPVRQIITQNKNDAGFTNLDMCLNNMLDYIEYLDKKEK